ncbi:hypothetical protein CDL12_04860 [Handroanthus impetiginosus]|uniref:Uncharacterized protein n=1 Tax=Handroanthus impetiginosus TaxID=429701 RepID=A0A2G9HYL1_9LAMI|nr:hypothetical protein CDL12_04860 [Handroanthus impetiginosus]
MGLGLGVLPCPPVICRRSIVSSEWLFVKVQSCWNPGVLEEAGCLADNLGFLN